MCLTRYFVLIVFLLLNAGAVVAQKVDSLREEIKIISVDSTNMQDTTNLPTDENIQEQQERQKTQRVRINRDTTETVIKDSARLALEKINRQATRRSAILPGWGQVTNGKWWKVPIIYGGFVGVALSIDFNQRYYKHYLEEAQYRHENPGQFLNDEYKAYNTESIIRAKDYHRRNRDLSVLLGLGVYALNIIDAYVDSKMFRYDMGDELAIRWGASVQTIPGINTHAVGFRVAFFIP